MKSKAQPRTIWQRAEEYAKKVLDPSAWTIVELNEKFSDIRRDLSYHIRVAYDKGYRAGLTAGRASAVAKAKRAK